MTGILFLYCVVRTDPLSRINFYKAVSGKISPYPANVENMVSS